MAEPGDALRALWAEREIRAVLVRYARGIDRCDEELIRSVYHPDATDEHGDFRGGGFEFAAWVVPILRDFESTMHDLGNVSIRLEGAVAEVESYVVAYHVLVRDEGKLLVTVGGRYLDRFEERAGEWKIARRVVVVDWTKTEPLRETFPTGRFLRGARYPDDPSYGDVREVSGPGGE